MRYGENIIRICIQKSQQSLQCVLQVTFSVTYIILLDHIMLLSELIALTRNEFRSLYCFSGSKEMEETNRKLILLNSKYEWEKNEKIKVQLKSYDGSTDLFFDHYVSS